MIESCYDSSIMEIEGGERGKQLGRIDRNIEIMDYRNDWIGGSPSQSGFE